MNDTELIQDIQRRTQESRAIVTPYSFGELANMYQEGELRISPDYQRLFRWSDEKQSQFLESLLLELPVPPLFLIQLPDETYELADGLQRMSTYLRFTGVFKDKPPEDSELLDRVKDPLVISGCDIVKGLNSYDYRSLPAALAIRLRRSRIDCAIVKLGSDPELKYYIFKRLNSGGEQLSDQESRSSFTRMLNPDAVDFIIHLSRDRSFSNTISAITELQREKRFDQELVLRFFSLLERPNQFKHDIEPFLTDFLERLAKREYNFESLESIFLSTFKRLDESLGSQAFTFAEKNQFSALHFEGIAIACAILIQTDELAGSDLKNRIMDLKRDPDFQKVAKGGGKNSGPQFRQRVEIASQYLKK